MGDALSEAQTLLRSAVPLSVAKHGEEHDETVETMAQLAEVLHRLSQLEEAERLHRRCLNIRTDTHGLDDERTLHSMTQLAMVLRDRCKLDEAEQLNLKAWKLSIVRSGEF